MSRNQRLALLGLAALILVLAIVVIGGGDDDPSQATTPSPTTSTPAERRTDPVRIVVRGAKPVGGVQKLTFKKGATIEFVVSSDTADEVHLHGYDIAKTVAAGGSVRFEIPATIDGRFEVELHESGEAIAEIAVEP